MVTKKYGAWRLYHELFKRATDCPQLRRWEATCVEEKREMIWQEGDAEPEAQWSSWLDRDLEDPVLESPSALF